MPPNHRDYTVGCICPMGVELAPVKAMLDHIHPPLPTQRDQNSYILGNLCGHNVAIAVLPEIGNHAAATSAVQLLNDFPSIRFGLLVGIGGGVPGGEDDEQGIRLGDVVVSKPTATLGGVVQYDLGKYSTAGGFERTGMLNKPPALLRATIPARDASWVSRPWKKNTLIPEYSTISCSEWTILTLVVQIAGIAMCKGPLIEMPNKRWQPYAAAAAAAYVKELCRVSTPVITIFYQFKREMERTYDLGINSFDAPDMADEVFVGRAPEIKEMENVLLSASDSGLRRVLVLGGMGGIGKTQLSITYAKRHRKAYSSVF
ncbi:hypothetical protein EDD37DRAFT_647689 [Exophiala viscosa]|uniref:uncharacterized protein n=1 Tax=Exophiala viscosa TaxID=2486360 RepID=UPI00218F2730|nr:hypothetical protein EDD37DRAFT_647689 [Exophiala viscosa]